MARPTKCTQEVTARMVECLEIGSTYKAAAMAGGINVNTFRTWMNKGTRKGARQPYSGFHEAVKAAEAQAERHALQRVRDAMPKSWQAAAWLLERRYGYTRDGGAYQEASVAASGTLAASDDMLAQLEAALTDARTQRHAAQQDGSHVAARGYLDLELRLMEQVRDERARRKAEATKEGSDPEQYLAALEEFFQRCPMQDLDKALLVWAERNGVLISKDEHGKVHLHYREKESA